MNLAFLLKILHSMILVANSFHNTAHKACRITILFLLIFCVITTVHCKPSSHEIKLNGQAQGTTYQVTYYSEKKENYSHQIDSLLKSIDQSLSTYVPGSIISQVNRNEDVVVNKHFITVFNKAQEISQRTNGAFDITVAPIINAYGFGFTKKAQVDSLMLDSLLRLVGYKNVRVESDKVVKTHPGIMLDMNAIAQGYSVDVLSLFLEENDIRNYMVELGGEVRVKGRKLNDEPWKIGIDQPNETFPEGRPLHSIISLQDRPLATSGNYRKFYIENGRKYAHIIDPKTGFPAKHNLLSATVLAEDCMTADAFATAFMVMGMEKAKEFLMNNAKDMQVFFIYDENGKWKTYASETLKTSIQEIAK